MDHNQQCTTHGQNTHSGVIHTFKIIYCNNPSVKHPTVDFHECEAHSAIREFKPKLLGGEALGTPPLKKWLLEAFMADEMVPKTRCYLTHLIQERKMTQLRYLSCNLLLLCASQFLPYFPLRLWLQWMYLTFVLISISFTFVVLLLRMV